MPITQASWEWKGQRLNEETEDAKLVAAQARIKVLEMCLAMRKEMSTEKRYHQGQVTSTRTVTQEEVMASVMEKHPPKSSFSTQIGYIAP